MRAEEAAVSGLALGSVAGHSDALIQAKQAASNVYQLICTERCAH